MGIESGKGKEKARTKPKPKPKVAMTVRQAETQDQHDVRIRQKQKKLDDKAVKRKDAVKKVGGNTEEVDRLRKVHTKNKLRLKSGGAVSLEMRGEYAFMLKAGVKVKLGKIFKVGLRQEVKLSGEPGKRTAQLYKLKLETSVLGAVLGLEGYQQKEKRKMYFGYTVEGGTLKIIFLGQFTKTPDKIQMSARVKLSKKLSRKIRLFADVTLNKPDKPGSLRLGDVEGAVGLHLPNNQTVAFYATPGDKKFALTYFGRF